VLFELRGVTVLSKVALLLCLPNLSPSNQLTLLMLLVFCSVMASHSPRWFRHRSLLPRPLRERLNIDSHPNKKTKS